MTMTDSPTLSPSPAAEVSSDGPTLLLDDALLSAESKETEGPSFVPPAEIAVADAGAGNGITAWHGDKKITAMWSNSSAMNTFAAVSGLGWRKVANVNEASYLALVTLLSHAEQTGGTCRLRIEADNKIHEAYVF